MIKYILIILSVLLIQSCIPDEDPLPPHEEGDLSTATAEMGRFYDTQIYYDLSRDSATSIKSIMDWDLAFDCSFDNNYIMLNYARFMRACNLGQVDINTLQDALIDEITEEQWQHDRPSGNRDSLAIGAWWQMEGAVAISIGDVYAIDLGIDQYGQPVGHAFLQMLARRDGTYSFIYRLTGKDRVQDSISVSDGYSFVYYSMSNSGQVEAAPPDADWDILFTRYTELLYTDEDEPMWYTVTSAIINEKYTEVAYTHDIAYDEITLASAEALTYSNNRNVIGHTWKYFDLNSNSYSVDPDMIYILKDGPGYYYKLHFIDFYNDKGVKGYPKFEFNML